MNYAGYGVPYTKASGYAKSIPAYGTAVAPGVAPYGIGKPFGKAAKAGKAAKPFGKVGKPFGIGKPFGAVGVGYPATKATGYGAKVPATTVATTPVPGVI